jgi:hypothetical protein
MKKNRKNRSAKLREKIEKDSQKGGSSHDDPREWKLTRDKASNGFAVIRFLPPSEADIKAAGPDASPEDIEPWALLYKHGFKVNGKWFINECPRTIGKDCPVCEAEKEAVEAAGGWDLPREHPARKRYTERKGGKNYYSNILVVKDPANPENEGKVFIFRYGAKIHEKLVAPMFPEFEDEESMDPFCPWEGANFKLKVMKKDGYVNYDRSEFESPSAIADDDEEIEAILGQMHELSSYLKEDKFKDYDKLKAEYERIINGKAPTRSSIEDDDDEAAGGTRDRKVNDDDDKPARTSGRRTKPAKKEEAEEPAESNDSGEEDGDDMAYFQGLLDED